ncbi:MAG: hypothetical protein CM15mP120_07720 [Pseudomonadota bacterium]|nr:MAG: hypothetical protein CM15mP120_07720 [Pseudomonadota bacterium]
MSQDAPSSAEEKRFFGRLRKGLAKPRPTHQWCRQLFVGRERDQCRGFGGPRNSAAYYRCWGRDHRAIIDELTTQVTRKHWLNGRSIRCVTSFNDQRLARLEKPLKLASNTTQVVFLWG